MADKISNLGAERISGKQSTQLIDISDKPTKAKVVREGFEVPSPVLDEKKTTFLLDNLVTVLPKFSPRVVSQSIPPGTKVTPGTVVNLVLAPKDAIPFEVFDNVHADLKAKPLSHVDEVVENVTVREVLLKRDKASDVTAEEKQLLVTEFQKKGVTVNEADSNRTFAKAFDSIRGAAAFR